MTYFLKLGPLLWNGSNTVGVCYLGEASQNQPLEPDGMDGAIADFKLWGTTFDTEKLINHTDCNPLSDGIIEDGLEVSNATASIGNGVMAIPSEADTCNSSTQKEPMYLKLMADYFTHSKVCYSLGGTKYLPRTQQDFAVMQGMVLHAPSMFKVIGDMPCNKVWIPLMKEIGDNGWATESGEKITLLPFSPGKDM